MMKKEENAIEGQGPELAADGGAFSPFANLLANSENKIESLSLFTRTSTRALEGKKPLKQSDLSLFLSPLCGGFPLLVKGIFSFYD